MTRTRSAAARTAATTRATEPRVLPRRIRTGSGRLRRQADRQPARRAGSHLAGSHLGGSHLGGLGLALALQLLQLLLDHLPLERTDEVDQQLAGQVVVLVQQAAREQAFALELERVAV